MYKLIIIDDEEQTREGLREVIAWETLGVMIAGTACDGVEGLELVERVQPDIIISDVRMARMDGITFITKVRQLLPSCKIIFISGYSDKEYLKSAISLRAISYVEKPINLQEMTDSIKDSISLIEEEQIHQKKSEEAKQMVSLASDYIKNQLVLDLTNPPINITTMMEQLNTYCPDFIKAEHYYTILFQVKSMNDVNEKPFSPEQMKRFLNTVTFSCMFAEKYPGLYIIHIGDKSAKSTADIHNAIDNLYVNFYNEYSNQYETFIAVGSLTRQVHELKKSYSNAVIALQNLFFTGYNHIVFFDSNFPQKTAHFVLDATFLTTYLDALRNNQEALAIEIINKLTNSIKKNANCLEISHVKNIFYEFVQETTKIFTERNLSIEALDENSFIWQIIFTKETLKELSDYLLDKVRVYFNRITELGQNGHIVLSIKQCIEKYYHLSDFSINMIAEILYFTPAYLCQVFKTETGITINTYLTLFRVECSKTLLKDKSLKLTEIAVNVGYTDANYFTRIFKKNLGITPSEYRERFIL